MSIKKENRKRIQALLPGGIYGPMIELIGNREAVIEGCYGVVEYNDSLVSLNCKKTSVTFEGADINLKALSSDVIEVTGVFNCISFCSL